MASELIAQSIIGPLGYGSIAWKVKANSLDIDTIHD